VTVARAVGRDPVRRPLVALLGVLVAVLAAAVATPQEATYRVRGRHLPITSAVNGHVQTATVEADGSTLVRVATSWNPIGASGPYAALASPQREAAAAGFALPSVLRQRLDGRDSAWETATRVLEWVMAHVELEPADAAPQDATSVLARRRGRCSGLANLSSALLLAAGFEARTVSGLLVDRDSVTPHRWVECRLPGAGWVPTDPTLGLWIVTPRHLAFADAVTEPPEVATVAVSETSLACLPSRDRRPLRPNEGSGLVCKQFGVLVAPWPVAVLQGPTGETQRSVLQPEGRFSQLLPGRWMLTVELDGRVVERRQLELKAGAVHSLTLELARGSEVGS
jgi:hypothetical protein